MVAVTTHTSSAAAARNAAAGGDRPLEKIDEMVQVVSVCLMFIYKLIH